MVAMMHATSGVVAPGASRPRGVSKQTPVPRAVPDASVRSNGARLGGVGAGLGALAAARGRVGFGAHGEGRVAAVNAKAGALEATRARQSRRTRGVRAAAAAADAGSGSEDSGIVKPKVSMGKLQLRITSALVLSFFGLGSIIIGGWVWTAVMSITATLSAREYFQMIETMPSELPHPPPKWALNMSIAMCALFIPVVYLAGAKQGHITMAVLGAFSAVGLRLIQVESEPHFSKFTSTLFGIIYCGALPAFWVKLRSLNFSAASTAIYSSLQSSKSNFVNGWPATLGGPEAWTTGLIVTVICVACIIASDVGAYAFGKTFGKHRLIAVSPNKTVEGALGGLLCTMATAYGLRWLFGWHAGPVQTLTLGAVIFVAAVAGDLMESVMKRNAGMKDSGDIIPGHGGFLDRFDSYMFTGIAAYFYIVTVMPHWFLGMTL